MKRVAWVVDTEGWAQERRGLALKKHLPEFDIQVKTIRQFRRWPHGPSGFDLALFASWRTIKGRMDIVQAFGPERCLAGVGGEYEIGTDPHSVPKGVAPTKAFGDAVAVLRQFRKVLVVSERLFKALSPHVPGTVYAPNGVETEAFPKCKSRFWSPAITVGWIGKPKAAKNVALLNAVSDALLDRPEIYPEFLIIDRDLESCAYDYKQIPGVYARWDFSLNVSWSEGLSNVLLESACMGVVPITVDVGDHCKLVRDGETGFVCERSLESVVATIKRAAEMDAKDYAAMSRAIREEVCQRWDWRVRAEAYRKALEEVCGG